MAESTTRPTCPDCGFRMVRRTRRSDGEPFWGCPRFPACRGTRPIDDVPSPPPAPPTVTLNRDRPGGSAHRQYERRRERREERIRAAWPDIVFRSALVVVFGLGLVVAAPPAWALAGWSLAVLGVVSGLTRVFVLPTHVTSWETGGNGERATAARLAPLADEGFRLLHDRRIPWSVANIDHIVVGPTGVWVIETKSYRGRLHVGRGELRVDGRRRAGVADEVAREMEAVAQVVAPVPVSALIVVHRADFPLFGSLRLGGVPVVPPRELVRRISRGSLDLTPEKVNELAEALDRALPPALGG